ncbi:uncharacterized protein LOC129740091 [Uranotaenia lowii]|uniref:uncharacterized protein LOC129740091 n=1 Tax=Uranotaenia lowii TaxID=190385 RepID=UPI0024795268|nr:uncharacterized protein LOC129740091 [Uranotaenia lowii]
MAKLIVLTTLLLIGINGWLLEEKSSQVSALSIGYELLAAMLDTLNANVQKANKLSEEQFKALKEELSSIRETVRSIESRTKENSAGKTDRNAYNWRTTEDPRKENSVTPRVPTRNWQTFYGRRRQNSVTPHVTIRNTSRTKENYAGQTDSNDYVI